MVINKPGWLFLLLLLIPFAVLAFKSHSSGKKTLFSLGGKWRFESFLNIFIVKNFFSYLCFFFFFIFTVCSLADIRWNDQMAEDDRDGYEIILAVDISRSMLADDIKPTRLDRAIEKIRLLLDNMDDTRFGIVVFKGKAVSIMPVTDDREGMKIFLNTIRPEIITVPGSNIEDAIKVSLDQFKLVAKFRAIFLFTDGESKTGNTQAAVAIAKKKEIPVYPFAAGTAAGSSINLGNGNLLKDKKGNVVVSKADFKALEKIADASGARLFDLNAMDAASVQYVKRTILSLGKSLDNENINKSLKSVKKETTTFFVSLSLLFLLLFILVRSIRWAKML